MKERLDALSPVSQEAHDKIEEVIMDPLKAAINVVENGHAQNHLDAIAKEIKRTPSYLFVTFKGVG